MLAEPDVPTANRRPFAFVYTACCHASIVIVSSLWATAEHSTTLTGTAAVMMTANGLSSSVACRQTCCMAASVAVAVLAMGRTVTASFLPATPPWALMSAATAFATLPGSPMSGARCCWVRIERSAVISETRIASAGTAASDAPVVDACLLDDELVHAANKDAQMLTSKTDRTKRDTRTTSRSGSHLPRGRACMQYAKPDFPPKSPATPGKNLALLV